MISNKVTINKTHCGYHEQQVLLYNKKGNVHGRLASCPKFEALETDSIIGVINNDTKNTFQLQKVYFKCSVNDTSSSNDVLDVHLTLEIVITAAAEQPLDELDLVVICTMTNDSSLGSRHDAGHYNIVYETSKFQYCSAYV